MQQVFRVGLFCGGPSEERGISLNSARCLLDHMSSDQIAVVPYYFDTQKNVYQISSSQLYSNTPSDFDFKLKSTARYLSEKAFLASLKKLDIVFPAMHGIFGEDGQIQSFLEKQKIPFVGSHSSSCKKVFDKYGANTFLQKNNFFTLPSLLIEKNETHQKEKITDFLSKHSFKKVIVKPAQGGSSIGVSLVSSVAEAAEKVSNLFAKGYTRVVVEPFAKGKEFTVIVLQNDGNDAVALLPSEIETADRENQLFDFRKKYLPTHQVRYHCPPRFSHEITARMQSQAEKLFQLLQMQDFARFDGWVLDSGDIWFSDINPISGMEQNSFLFQQASRIGFSHTDILHYILRHAAKRYNLSFPQERKKESSLSKKEVSVLFGGNTSERQVSVMSGTNVWLKLRKSKKYNPHPYLLDLDNTVWHLPYAITLSHTVEEITANCLHFTKEAKKFKKIVCHMQRRLLIKPGDVTETLFTPKRMSLSEFIKQSEFVFIALHGGIGENGTLQALLEKNHKVYNGANANVSALCMHKQKTSQFIKDLSIPGVGVANNALVKTKDLLQEKDYEIFWQKLQKNLHASSLIAKPNSDGCSSGVVHLYQAQDLQKYILLLQQKTVVVPKNTFTNQPEIIEMPRDLDEILFETFITTDRVQIENNRLVHTAKTGWIEVTVGVIQRDKKIHVFNPSITIAEGGVLSVEEKFQGGTGINITPPPTSLIVSSVLKKIKKRIQKVAEGINIAGYARIDAFVHIQTGKVSVIEINTLPGLTPSTVFFQQALAENLPIQPITLLENLIENKHI